MSKTVEGVLLDIFSDKVAQLSAGEQAKIGAAFGVHKDMKSHKGAIMTLELGAICSISTKQKVNARSLAEAELISLDNVKSKVLWVKNFLEAQGFTVDMNII